VELLDKGTGDGPAAAESAFCFRMRFGNFSSIEKQIQLKLWPLRQRVQIALLCSAEFKI
jgi:hypothetical protein